MLEFNIRNQEVSRIDNFSPAEKSVGYLEAKFNFKTEDWNEATKRAIFRNVKSKVEKDAMLEDDACIVPWEVLVGSGEIEVSVHGVGKETITTDVATFNLDRTLSGGSASEEPSPTVYEQMIKEMQEAKDIAQSVRDDADAGKFNGKDGKDGKDGESGTGKIDEEQLLQFAIKTTTSPSPFHHITDSANMKVLDFGMEGKTEQYTGTITDESGNEITVPNPDYPQEIVNAGKYNEETGRYEIGCMLSGKNNFDLENAEIKPKSIFDYTTGEVKAYGDTGNAVLNYWKIVPRITYTVSATENTGSSQGFLEAVLYDSDKKCTRQVGWNRGSFTFTANENEHYIRVWYKSNDVNTLQIEPSPIQTEYKAFDGVQQFTLTSDRPLTKWDKLVKRDGVWGWSIWSRVKVFDGTYGCQNIKHNDVRTIVGVTLEDKLAGVSNIFCTNYRLYTKSNVWQSSELLQAMSGTSNKNQAYFNISPEVTTHAEWKEFTAENPIKVIYETSTEQSFHPLPDEEQTLLNNLETYYGVTNVYNEQGCPMWLRYVNDTKLYVDNKLLEIQQAII